MDRVELRFRILFEYYNEMHSASKEIALQADNNIHEMDIPDFEKNAAQIWLIDSGYVEGSFQGDFGTPIPSALISRINNIGIDYVESVIDIAFTEIKDKFKDIEQLSKTEKIQKFAEECLNYPIANEICQITYAAIVEYITHTSN